MLTKKNCIRRGDNVEQQKKLYKEGRQCWTTTKNYIRKGDNVDRKNYIRRGDNVDQKKTI